MFCFSQWFTGVTLILIYLKGYFSPIESHECRSKVIKTDSLYVDCVDKDIVSIPQDINENLEILNISRNPTLNELKEDDLKKYDDLVELTMKELKITKISPHFFGPAKLLKMIDISSTCFSEPIPKLPAGMEHIIANSIHKPCSKVSLPEMKELEHLIEFESRENELNDLPLLHINAPIQFIDLSKNPMKNLKYTDIAHLCILSQLNLFGTDLGEDKYHQQCCGLQKWGEYHKISIHLQCDKQCENVQFDVKAIEAFDQCAETPGSRFLPFDYIIYEILIFIVVVLSIGYLAFRHFKSDAVKRYQRDRKLRPQKVMDQFEHEEELVGENEEVGDELYVHEEDPNQ